MKPALPLWLRRAFCAAILGFIAPALVSAQTQKSICTAKARRVLGPNAIAIAAGSFLYPDSSLICVAVIPIEPQTDPTHTRAQRGVVLELKGKSWKRVLWFDNQIQNEKGYIGIDFIDPNTRYGFAVTFDEHRSDGTKGFTIYFSYLNSELKAEGLPIEVSWNPKSERFQEYAPNELDPPDFKPEILNPPVRSR